MTTALRNTLLGAIACVAIICSLTACNSSSGDDPIRPDDKSYIDIVTLVAANKDGFSVNFRKDGDSPLVTLTCAQRVDTNLVKPGQRFLLQYWPMGGQQYVSGTATAYAYKPILNANVIFGTAQQYNAWNSEQQQIMKLWRTGTYLNVSALLTNKVTPKRYQLVVDEKTRNDAYPVARILFLSDDAFSGNDQQFWASFNIAQVWNQETCKGLRVIANTNDPGTLFEKDGQQTITPQN